MKISKILSQAALSVGSALAIVCCPSDRLLAQAESALLATPSLPSDVAFTLSFSTKLETWQDLNRFHLFRELYLAAFTDLEVPENFNIQADLLSWLGDRGHIILLSRTGDGSPEAELEEKLVVAIPINDVEKYSASWKKFQEDDKELIDRTYRGALIQESRDVTSPECQPAGQSEPASESPSEPQVAPTPTLPPAVPPAASPKSLLKQTEKETSEVPKSCVDFVTTIVPGYAIYAISPKPIEAFLDAQLDGTPLDPKLERTLKRPEMASSLIAYYADLPKLVDWIKAFAPEQPSATEEPIEETVPPQPESGKTKQLLAQATPAATPSAAPSPATLETPSPDSSPSPIPPDGTEPEPSPPSQPDPAAAIDRAFKPLLRDYDSVDAFLFAQPEGLRVQSRVYYKEPLADRADVELPGANSILRRIPGATYVAGNSRNLKAQWQEIVEVFEEDPDLKTSLELIRSGFKAATDLDLEDDVLAWMDGEYAAFAFPTRKGFLAQIDPGLQLGISFAVQTSDRSAAEAAIRKLEESVVFKFGEDFDIKRQTIAGTSITSWEIGPPKFRQSILAYGWTENDTLLITQGADNIAELLQPYGKVLPDYFTFNTATDSLPVPNQGYAYMNMGSVLALVNTLTPPFVREDEYFQIGMQVLATIRSFSATNLTTAEYDQGDALVALAPVLPKQESQVGKLAAKIRRQMGFSSSPGNP